MIEWSKTPPTADEVAAREQALEWALAKVRERDAEIARLNAALDMAVRSVGELEQEIADRGAKIGQLRTALANEQSTRGMEIAEERDRLADRVAAKDTIVAAARDLVSMMRVKCNRPGCKACVLWDAIRTLDAKKDA